MTSVQVTIAELQHGVRLLTGQAHRLVYGRPRRVRRVRLVGMFFDLAKCFLLPSAMRGIRKVRDIYDEHPGAELLVVGHTDMSGKSNYNDALALERSRAVIAYLGDDVDAWLQFYRDAVSYEKRWGSREDLLMLSALPEAGEPYFRRGSSFDTAVRKFQDDHDLKVDGIAGPETRRALVAAYMHLDGTSVPPGTTMVAHGCGENFPEVPTPDGVQEPRNRRVEIFVFDQGIDPPPSGATSGPGAQDYPAWVAKVQTTFDFSEDSDEQVLQLRLHDEECRPMPGTFYRVLSGGGEPASGRAGPEGFVTLDLPPVCPVRIEIQWGSDASGGPFQFTRSVLVHCNEGNDDQRDRVRLHNLGYDPEADFTTAVRAFQVDYQVDHKPEPVGLVGDSLPPATRKRLEAIFKELNCDATPPADS